MNQVEPLLKLADEYQAGGVVDICVKILKSEPKPRDNAVKILHLASSTATARADERLFEVREQCYELMKDMELTESYENGKSLEKEIWERVLVKRIQRLETFVREIYPQFVDFVEFSLSESLREAKTIISPCPRHFSNGKANEHLLKRMKDCPGCWQMIKQLIFNLKKSKQSQQSFQSFGASAGNLFGACSVSAFESDPLEDEKTMMVILDFEKIMRV